MPATPDDDPLSKAHDAIADEIEYARGLEHVVDGLRGASEVDRLPLRVMLRRHVAGLDAIRDEIERVPGFLERAAAGAAPYNPRQFLETGPRIVAEDADRVAIVFPIARDRVR